MIFNLQLFIGIVCICSYVATDRARFDNYRVYKLKVNTQDQLDVLKQIEKFPDGFSFWDGPVLGQEAELMVPPHKFGEFSEICEQFGIWNKLKITNVQKLVDNELSRAAPLEFGWEGYYPLDKIYEWVDKQLVAYPNILSNLTVGTSYQGRTIRAVKLSHNVNNPTIVIESTIHAREWVTVSTATYLLNELLTSNDTQIQDLAKNFNWIIIPVLNVDGYVYTHQYNRLWRKTRKPSALICYGVDANRNFDFHFAEVGTSPNPCSETYPGPKPFSEYETQALADFINGIDLKLYISFHSYGQYLMYPYGHTHEGSWNDKHLEQIAKKSVEAIGTRFKTEYVYGTIANTIYEAAGGSIDWVFGVKNVSLSYVFEFRDHRDGNHGFLLPAEQIIPNCLEFLDGLKALVNEARSLKYF